MHDPGNEPHDQDFEAHIDDVQPVDELEEAKSGLIDWNKGAEELLSEKHILSRNAAHIDMETDLLAHDLKDLGFESNIRDLNSGLTAIEIRDDIYIGAADPRREGIALGQ